MATEVSSAPSSLPQLQSVQKAMALPTVGAAVEQVGAFYTKVKGAHCLLEWALSTAEASVVLAASTAAPYVSTPLSFGDAKVAAAIDHLEKRVPLVTEQPKVIVETTIEAVISRISSRINKVCDARAAAKQRVKSLKELSWTKANALLSTAYGQKAIHGVDSGAAYAMQLLDHYLPPVPAGPQEESTEEIAAVCDDPALHTVQTVGRLSAVAARRVWANLAYKVNELRTSGIELDLRRYVTALLAALHLARVTSQQQQKDPEKETEVIKDAVETEAQKDAKETEVIKDAEETVAQKDAKETEVIKDAVETEAQKDAEKETEAIKDAVETEAQKDAEKETEVIKDAVEIEVQKNAEETEAKKDAEPAPCDPAPSSQESSPTTAAIVKITPESKSTEDPDSQ